MAGTIHKLPYRRRVNPQTAGGRKRPLFACKSQAQDADCESVKTECLGKGYRLLGKTLGEGAYAKVGLAEVSASKLARSKALSDSLDGASPCVAVKVINKKAVPKEFLRKFLPRELDNHSTLPHHPNVVQVFEHFSTAEQVFLVMEYCEKGDLLDSINKAISNNQRGLGEELTKKIFKQMCQGVQHIHNHTIVHRDLKCENILLTADNTVKITDFGFSCRFEDRNMMLKTSCGSYAYTAPEVIKNKPYDGYKADVWSLGIILFAMVNGRLPYNDSQLTEMDEDMRMQRLRFERSVSFDCMVLIRKMLQYNPLLRPSIQEALTDSWITGKKPIPRQLNKPKWINPYSANKDGGPAEKEKLRVDGAASEKSSPLCYRGDSPERIKPGSAPNATVTINQRAGETVTLKSRVKQQKYKSNESRPQTWPKTEKERKREDERLVKRRGKTAPPRKPVQPEASARLTQLLELTKHRKPRQEVGLEHGETSVPIWYMYKILQNSCKPNFVKSHGKGEAPSSATGAKTGSRQVVWQSVQEGGSKKRPQNSKYAKASKNGGTVKLHVDPSKSGVIDKLAKTSETSRSDEGDTPATGKTSPPQQPAERLSPADRSRMVRERFLRVYGPNTPQNVKEFPLPPLLVQRLEILENNPKFKSDADVPKPCTTPVTGSTSPEPVPQFTVSTRSHRKCSGSARVKPVYKTVYHP